MRTWCVDRLYEVVEWNVRPCIDWTSSAPLSRVLFPQLLVYRSFVKPSYFNMLIDFNVWS